MKNGYFAVAALLPSGATSRPAIDVAFQSRSVVRPALVVRRLTITTPLCLGHTFNFTTSSIQQREGATTAKPAAQPRRKMSAAAKAKLSAMAKARWRKARAAGKNAL